MKALFLDRDGVISLALPRGVYVLHPEELWLMPEIRELIRAARERDYLVAMISNQSVVGRGMLDLARLELIHAKMHTELLPERLDALYYCPHAPEEGCVCRKPAPGMLLKAAQEHGLHLGDSLFVGDNVTDVLAGTAAGVRTVFLNNAHNAEERRRCQPNHVVDSLGAIIPLL
ncbi:MAG: D,D-heptose 1,7-bisphosphate phosphatase [Candidatus Harrisonbacteria bacterium CG10_big_fil_rev_8_21_14_0_10_49_15]|uniref:D,D-heptose 1,7-bisphosphate phosphatase n=1 Tax=Candidatus Harrisonbacteria bacterium CG10_big_fil_rev_8_21_14_0_10_49_15 TaxID=1974587 RepID=A0A2H0ULY4_9BACT|nr:MAG: D,D-heptose 1,7-bisphosphate phosphatase [Candidatus Harrisonbacteria bacterium CG10_big_fil_rev_8_21_14_0_10_49_15]